MSKVPDDAQVLSIWSKEWLLVNFYAPPPSLHGDPQMDVCNLVLEMFGELLSHHPHKWFAVGDANEEPGDSCIQSVLEGCQGSILSTGTPTRFSGNRSNSPQHCDVLGPGDLHFSDHKIVQYMVFLKPLEILRWVILRKLLIGLNLKGFPRKLGEALSKLLGIWKTIEKRLSVNWDELGVDESWDLYMTALNRMFKAAFQLLINSGDLPAKELCLRQSGAISKGSTPQWQQRFWARSARKNTCGSMKIIKLRKRLARTYEFQRLLLRQNPWVHKDVALAGLAKRLQYDCVSPQVLPKVRQDINRLKTDLKELDKQDRNERLKKWKDDLIHNPKSLGNWLRARERPCITKVQFDQTFCHHPKEVTKGIRSFWEFFWTHQGYNESSDEVLRNFGFYSPQFFSPKLEAPWKKLFDWLGSEVKRLPRDCLRLFRCLALKWEKCGMVPNSTQLYASF